MNLWPFRKQTPRTPDDVERELSEKDTELGHIWYPDHEWANVLAAAEASSRTQAIENWRELLTERYTEYEVALREFVLYQSDSDTTDGPDRSRLRAEVVFRQVRLDNITNPETEEELDQEREQILSELDQILKEK